MLDLKNNIVRERMAKTLAVLFITLSIVLGSIVQTAKAEGYKTALNYATNISDCLDQPINKMNKTVKDVTDKIKAKKLSIKDRIRNVCKKYNVSYKLALAIAKLETGHFKSYAYKHKNNPGGLSRNEVPIRFKTIDEGVEAFIKNLKKNYIDEGLTTPESIGKKYCPNNPKWSKLVRSLM